MGPGPTEALRVLCGIVTLGGRDVLMQATEHPGPWEGGLAYNGIAELAEFSETMAKRRDRIRDQLGEAGLDRLESLSPANRSQQVGIPLMVLQGEHDRMTSQLRRFVAETWAGGAHLEYEEIPALAHWTRNLEQKLGIWEAIEEFLERITEDGAG